MQTYWELGRHNRNSVLKSFPFNAFWKRLCYFAGLERMVNYLNNLRFTETDISYLRELDYPEDFWTTWRSFALQVQSVLSKKENSFCQWTFGSDRRIVAECQLIETAVLNIINFKHWLQPRLHVSSLWLVMILCLSLVHAVPKKWMLLFGTRAAYIGGADATSNVRAAKILGLNQVEHMLISSSELWQRLWSL